MAHTRISRQMKKMRSYVMAILQSSAALSTINNCKERARVVELFSGLDTKVSDASAAEMGCKGCDSESNSCMFLRDELKLLSGRITPPLYLQLLMAISL
ncbi:hypothetical protein EYF80_018410 [Liparis tanakae]|uniref:Uncharacterized protein n=1 Tax=Liparis tanakae TaxID=230148 RepID=A0A4Z2I282_9TELE|nr:hypothetical protein EYF80_018410 [Liparis tanakae]